jgi:hypothetical protein
MAKNKRTIPTTGRAEPRLRRCADGMVLQRAVKFTDRKKAASKNACRKGAWS